MTRSRIINGVAYRLGSAGSLILVCPDCGRKRFRQEIEKIEFEKCFDCDTQLELVRA